MEETRDEDDLFPSLNKDTGLAENDGLLLAASNHGRLSERMSEEQPLASEMCSISSQADGASSTIQCYRTRSPYEPATFFLAVKDRVDDNSGLNQSRTGSGCVQARLHGGPFTRDLKVSDCKKFKSLDEALVRCFADSDPLEIVSRLASSFHIPVKSRTSKMDFLLDGFKTKGKRRTKSTSDMNFFIQSSVLAGTVGGHGVPGSVAISPVGRWVINAIEGNGKSRNILGKPLFCHLADLDSKMSLRSSRSMDNKEISCLELDSLRSTPLHNKEVQVVPVGNRRHGLDTAKQEKSNRRVISFSSTDMPNSPSHASVSKGLLHCIWKGGIPYFVFTVDDRGEVYVANPWKLKSGDDKSLKWIYLFRSRMDGQKKQGKGSGDVSDIVGRMKVSSFLTPNSTKLNPSNFVETEFVLFGTSDGHREDSVRNMAPPTPLPRKNKGMQKKAVDMFRTCHLSKPDSDTELCRSRSEFKDIPQRLYPDMRCDLDGLGGEEPLVGYLPPNLELATIVVKEYHQQNNSRVAAVGGWGLKFLEKAATKRADDSLRTSTFSSENCQQNGSRSSTSMNVLVPAGFHGGPRTKNGGPSTLTDRWRSGGRCDCGGWDIGCPLTVLNSISSDSKGLSESEGEDDCKSVSLFIEGAKQGVPALKMVNIHEGLYFVHFQSTLSALQSFSIGVAIIHSQSPALCSKMYNN